MRHIITTAAICTLIFATLLSAGCSEKDKVIMVEDDDPEMVAAIAKGRETLPQFWQAFDRKSPDESVFSLKVEIRDSKGSEYFWITDIERKEGKLYGTINNDPNIVRTVKLGDRRPIPEADIADWLYKKGDKMVGNYTLRAMFKHMPPDEVASFKAMLIDP
jgi:uncharacterized protein YegJ (DUF2314 family)